METRYRVARFDEIPGTRCPCGSSRRAFVDDPGGVASVHVVDISEDAALHYHKRLTEFYLVLEGDGHLELDGELLPVGPMTCVRIDPGCRHRAAGRMRIAVVPVPAFDHEDEWFD